MRSVNRKPALYLGALQVSIEVVLRVQPDRMCEVLTIWFCVCAEEEFQEVF